MTNGNTDDAGGARVRPWCLAAWVRCQTGFYGLNWKCHQKKRGGWLRTHQHTSRAPCSVEAAAHERERSHQVGTMEGKTQFKFSCIMRHYTRTAAGLLAVTEIGDYRQYFLEFLNRGVLEFPLRRLHAGRGRPADHVTVCPLGPPLSHRQLVNP